MAVLAWVAGVIAALGFGMAGLAKLTWQPQMAAAADHLGLRKRDFQTIGLAEVAGAIGVIIGTAVRDFEFVGIGAAIGLAILGAGAYKAHNDAGDPPSAAMPVVVLTIAAILAVIGLTFR